MCSNIVSHAFNNYYLHHRKLHVHEQNKKRKKENTKTYEKILASHKTPAVLLIKKEKNFFEIWCLIVIHETNTSLRQPG